MSPRKTCPKCGSVVNEKDLFCVNCGSNLAIERKPALSQKRILFGIGIMAIVLVVILTLSQMPSLTPKPQPQISPEWHRVTAFEGSGSTSKTTESFYIPSDKWRITFDYRAHPNYPELTMFSFLVYPEGETTQYIELVHKTGQSKEDTTYLYKGKGNFYLKIITANTPEWLIIIEAYY